MAVATLLSMGLRMEYLVIHNVRKSLPAALDPLGEVRAFRADRRVEAVPRQHDRLGGEGEQFRVDRLDDGGEVAAVKGGISRAAGKERVAGEE